MGWMGDLLFRLRYGPRVSDVVSVVGCLGWIFGCFGQALLLRSAVSVVSLAASAYNIKWLKATGRQGIFWLEVIFLGWIAAWFALQRLQLPVELQFCSDSDAKCKALIKGIPRPKRFHDDVTTRTPDEELPVHLYIFTPPCQPFSCQGKRSGIQDKRARAMQSSFQYINRKRPRVALFENVPGILEKGTDLCFEECTRLWRKWDTSCGSRLWIVQIQSATNASTGLPGCHFEDKLAQKALMAQRTRQKDFVFSSRPSQEKWQSWQVAQKQECCTHGQTCVQQSVGPRIDARKQPVAVDVGCTEKFLTFGVDICRTLSRTRAASGGFWLSTLGRKMSVNELARANGMFSQETEGCLEHVSDVRERTLQNDRQ